MGQAQRRGRRDIRPQEVELWEISRDSDSPRMMRLADTEARRPERRRAEEQRPRPVRREAEGQRPRPVRREAEGQRPRPVRREAERERPRSTRQEAERYRAARAANRRRAKRRRELLCKCFTLIVMGVCLVLIYQTTRAVYRMTHDRETDRSKGIIGVVSEKLEEKKIEPPAITEDYLEINDYSRPGTKLKKVKSVFVHYTANPGTTAQQNRSYFANLAETHERSASAHFIIGYDGELIQCIPMEEQAYAVATRNEDSVSIECCYQDKEGKFTQETYDTLVHTLAWLTQEYNLSTEDILRHYDCGGKKCPLYYVEHEDAWERLLADVENYEPKSGQ